MVLGWSRWQNIRTKSKEGRNKYAGSTLLSVLFLCHLSELVTILACMCQKYNNNSNNGNALNQVVTLQFSISSVPFLPSLCWSWRPRQGRYSAGCFLSWKELNIQPAMLLLQCWKVALSRLRGVTGATSLSDLNTEQCFYLERKKKRGRQKPCMWNLHPLDKRAYLPSFIYGIFYSVYKMQSHHLIMFETFLFNIMCFYAFFSSTYNVITSIFFFSSFPHLSL